MVLATMMVHHERVLIDLSQTVFWLGTSDVRDVVEIPKVNDKYCWIEVFTSDGSKRIAGQRTRVESFDWNFLGKEMQQLLPGERRK